jgi:hypothetical protein
MNATTTANTTSAPSPSSVLLSVPVAPVDTATLREQQGQCPRCGQQLYRVSSHTTRNKGSNNNKSNNKWKPSFVSLFPSSSSKSSKRTPLTIPDKVERGQCLLCCHDPQQQATRTGVQQFVIDDDDNDDNLEEEVQLQKQLLQQESSHHHHHHHSTMMPSSAFSSSGSRTLLGSPTPHPTFRLFHGSNQTMHMDNGDVYQGDCHYGYMEGHGTYTFANHAGEYVGQFAKNHFSGEGTRRYGNGDVYTGSFHASQRHGNQGKLYYANGDLFVGSWANNDMVQGSYYYAQNRLVFQGTFVQGKRHGRGKLQRRDQSLEVFVYNMDQRVGQGLKWNAQRTKVWLVSSTTGRVQKQVSLAQAVSLEYELQQESERLLSQQHAGHDTSMLVPESVAESVHGMMA